MSKRPAKRRRKNKEKEEEEEEHTFKRILKKRGKGKNAEYLLEWSDGHDPTWCLHKYLVGQPALEEFENAMKPDKIVLEKEEEVKKKVKKVGEWMGGSKRIVWHVGAGISTSSGLPDFRGLHGLWTTNRADISELDMRKIKPGYGHKALVELDKAGYVYRIITQNYDDLFSKAGFPAERLSEIHGNLFLETCSSCSAAYHRDFPVEKEDNPLLPNGQFDHRTGRNCDECGGELEDTLVHFGEDLRGVAVANAKAKGADLSICIGTKLEVTPACLWPFYVHKRRNKGKVVIVNNQLTSSDHNADLVIHHQIDLFFKLLLKELNIEL